MSEKAHLLLSAFSRALSHSIRTPLSVVSNDLQFLKNGGIPAELNAQFDRSLAKIAEVSGILSQSSRIGVFPVRRGRISLIECLRESKLSWIQFDCPDEFEIEGERELLEAALSFLNELFHGFSGVLRGTGQCATLSFAGKSPVNLSGTPEWLKKYDTFTEVFNYRFGIDTLFPPIIDSILSVHECMVTLSFKGEDLLSDIVFTSI